MTAREFGWLMVFRWTATVLTVAAASAALSLDGVSDAEPLFGVAAGLGAFNLAIHLAAARHPRHRRSLTCAGLLFDVAALTAFLRFSGDIENPMRTAYALPVIAASLVVTRRFALMTAALSLVLFGGLVAAAHWNFSPIRIEHHHMAQFSVEHQADLSPYFSGMQVAYLGLLLFGSAYGIGTLAERLRRSEADAVLENERLQFLLKTLPDGVVLLRRDASVLLANPTALRNMAELAKKVDLPARIQSLSGAGMEFETRLGDRIFTSVIAQAAPADPVVWTFRDRTEQQRLMAQVIHGSKMADLGLLAAGIAHEIGNPLSSMSAIVQIMQRKSVDSVANEKLGALNTNIDRIRAIVRDVSHYATPPAATRRRVGMAAVVSEAVSIFRLHERGKDVRVSVGQRAEPPPVDVTQGQIVQVLLNLLLNAADASIGRGGIVVVVDAGVGEAVVSVQDDGPGMEEEVIRHLFIPFFTTKEPGSGVGLGLFICESIVLAHGGRIDVDSGPGRGSTFTIRLPAAA